jgi:hypothetical protein
MNITPENIKKAKEAGYSDQEIDEFINKKTPSSIQVQSKPQKSTFDKVGNYVGVNNLGNAVSSLLSMGSATKAVENSMNQKDQLVKSYRQMIQKNKANGNTKRAEALTRALQGLIGNQESVEDIATGGKGFVSDKQIIGDAVTLASLATGGLNPSKKLIGRVGQTALTGGTSGFGSALQDNKSITDALKSAATGATVGGLATYGGEKAMQGLKKVAKGTAENIYNRLIKTPVAQKMAGKEEIGTGLLKRGLSGSETKLLKKVGNISKQNSDMLDNIITKNADKPVDMTGVIDGLKDLQSKLANTPGESTNAVDDILKSFGQDKTISLKSAQELKKNLQAAVADAFLRQNTTGATQAQKIAAQKLRVAIEKAAPEVIPVNKELEFATRATKQLLRQAGASPSKLRLFTEFGLGAYGLLANPAVLAAIGGERLMTTPSTATPIAKGLYKASQKTINPKVNSAIEKLIGFTAGR